MGDLNANDEEESGSTTISTTNLLEGINQST
jgi:hypothetical protein